MSRPRRIQRRRERGWRKPQGAIYVGRPTKWGNPLWLRSDGIIEHWQDWRWYATGEAERVTRRLVEAFSVEYAAKHLGLTDATPGAVLVACFRAMLDQNPGYAIAARSELRGHDLMCWCDEDDPNCHADVWLEVANAA